MSGSTLGDLEQLVLLAVLRLAPDAYAVSVRDEIRGRTGREITRGAVYVTLDRLQRKGYLRSELGPSTPARGGKAKRMFTMEAAGLEALRSSLREIRQMTEGIEGEVAPARAP